MTEAEEETAMEWSDEETTEAWKRYGRWMARRNSGERETVDLTKPGAEEPPVNRTVAR